MATKLGFQGTKASARGGKKGTGVAGKAGSVTPQPKQQQQPQPAATYSASEWAGVAHLPHLDEDDAAWDDLWAETKRVSGRGSK